MTDAQVKAELERRFEAFLAEETEAMRVSGASPALIDALAAENRRRFETEVQGAVEQVCGSPLTLEVHPLAAIAPAGSA